MLHNSSFHFCGLIVYFICSVEIKIISAGSFLELIAVPHRIKLRSRLERFLYIRPCYSMLLADISTSLPKLSCKTVAVLGTAGIGKSSFLLYCIFKLQEDPALFGVSTRSFFFQEEEKEVWLYENVGGDEFTVRLLDAEDPLEASIPMFVDMQKPISPRPPSGPCLIFTSFQPHRYKELVKDGWSKIMPTWSAEEQSDLFASVEFRGEFNETIAERAFENIHYFGGAIRHNIRTAQKGSIPTKKIDADLNRKGQDICHRYFEAGFGGTEDDMADLLVHRNPVYEDGLPIFDAEIISYSFASPYVLQSLLQLNNQMLATEARNKYRAGTFRGGDNGNEFELLCLHGFKVTGVEFTALPLSPGSNESKIIFPRKEVLALNWREREGYLKQGVLYIPPYGNLESGDAFCVILLNGKLTLVIVQCTIAENHPVKQNGMRVILDCCTKKSKLKVRETVIVFMIPQNGKLKVPQRIVTQDGEDSLRTTVKVEKQYKIENCLVDVDSLSI